MLKKYTFLLCFLFSIFHYSQIDSISFKMKNAFLVFDAKINGIDTEVAMDTGAVLSVATSLQVANANIEVLDSEKRITDSNNKTTSIKSIKIKTFEFGNQKVENIKSLTADMPYLYCANFFLLGQDVIRKFNWKIDFESNKIYISKEPFTSVKSMVQWKIKYRSNRPITSYTINGKIIEDVLIDTGFTSELDIDFSNVKNIKSQLEQKEKEHKINTYLISSMGLYGLGKADVVKEINLNDLNFGGAEIDNARLLIKDNKESKIGILFFKNHCKEFIMNYTNNTFYFSKKDNPTIIKKDNLDIKLALEKGKILVIGKNTSPNSTANDFEINEEIKSINGKTAKELGDECQFLLWNYNNTEKEITVEKLNGKKYTIKRTSNH